MGIINPYKPLSFKKMTSDGTTIEVTNNQQAHKYTISIKGMNGHTEMTLNDEEAHCLLVALAVMQEPKHWSS